MNRTPWLERHFEAGLPPEMFPNVLERLRGTPARVEERLRDAAPGALTAKRGESWSILENVGHLVQVEGLWAARVDDFEARRHELTAARFEAWRVDQAQFNRRGVGELCADFRAVRGRLVDRLERLDDAVMRAVALHPRLGRPMGVVDLMVFIAEHDDHHLAAVTELLEARPN